MTRRGPAAIVTALLLLLTWLFIQSRSPGQASRTRAQESLQALQHADAALTHAVLLTRAGLLLHYDSLARLDRDIRRHLDVLAREAAALSARGDGAIEQQTRALAEALARKGRLVEDFASDNAVLRNSTTYLAHQVERLGRTAGSGAPVRTALQGSHVLMAFMQSPESTPREQVVAAVAAIEASGLDPPTLRPLVDHGRIIVRLLPRVDDELRSVLSVPVAARVDDVQQALLQSAGAAEAHAQRFRLLLYAAAIVLLAYLIRLVARLRAHAAELQRKETQLIQANKMTALGTLVSSVAHEINNPNQVVLTNSGALAAAMADVVDALDRCRAPDGAAPTIGGLPYPEMRSALPRLARDAQESARRIEQIVADLKDFARPGTNRRVDLLNLNDIVRRALRLLTHVIRKRTDALRVELAEPLPPVRGNAQQLEQITVNLVVNALEALPSRHRGVSVRTAHDSDSGRVVLTIEDGGVGMSADQLARLGEPFFTTRSASGGTGLGIAIASSLVRLHGGQLTFTSQPGRGTCAKVTVPAAAPTSIPAGAAFA